MFSLTLHLNFRHFDCLSTNWVSMPRKLATQCGVVWCRVQIQRPSPSPGGGEKEICQAPLPVARLQIAQSPAAKLLDQKGSTASALESSRSLYKFSCKRYHQVCQISFLCKRVVRDLTVPNLWKSFLWTYVGFFEIAHIHIYIYIYVYIIFDIYIYIFLFNK